MAMNQPNVMVGTAPEASYWLLRSEDEASEHLVEQDYWAAAIEFADSVGVVWLSPPMLSLPGAPKRATWTAWQMPLPGRDT